MQSYVAVCISIQKQVYLHSDRILHIKLKIDTEYHIFRMLPMGSGGRSGGHHMFRMLPMGSGEGGGHHIFRMLPMESGGEWWSSHI